MEIYYGSAIQGEKERGKRIETHRVIINLIKNQAHKVKSEHNLGKNFEEVAELLEKAIGPLPPIGIERTRYVRNKWIEFLEGETIGAAIFEVSIPSHGTGIEIAHSYLRPKLGLKEIPTLILYQKDYWPNKLSSMIRGLNPKKYPNIYLKEYKNIEELKQTVTEFLQSL